jgi:hypothetical protein
VRFEVDTDARADQSWRKVRSVHLDGVLLVGCLAADDVEGWVRELIPDPDKPGYFKHDGVEFLTRERRGRVEIALKDTSRDWDRERRGATRVQVGRDPMTGDILVQVFSVVRPGAIKQMRLALGGLPAGLDAKAQKAGMTAGAAAELLCEQFGDAVDPAAAARTAIEQCTAMLLAEQAPGGGSNFIVDQAAG